MPVLNVPSPELELNHNKIGMRSRGSNWEWYTSKVGKLGLIHIHNDTPSGQYTYRIRTSWEIDSQETFETRDAAYSKAWTEFLLLIQEVTGI